MKTSGLGKIKVGLGLFLCTWAPGLMQSACGDYYTDLYREFYGKAPIGDAPKAFEQKLKENINGYRQFLGYTHAEKASSPQKMADTLVQLRKQAADKVNTLSRELKKKDAPVPTNLNALNTLWKQLEKEKKAALVTPPAPAPRSITKAAPAQLPASQATVKPSSSSSNEIKSEEVAIREVSRWNGSCDDYIHQAQIALNKNDFYTAQQDIRTVIANYNTIRILLNPLGKEVSEASSGSLMSQLKQQIIAVRNQLEDKVIELLSQKKVEIIGKKWKALTNGNSEPVEDNIQSFSQWLTEVQQVCDNQWKSLESDCVAFLGSLGKDFAQPQPASGVTKGPLFQNTAALKEAIERKRKSFVEVVLRVVENDVSPCKDALGWSHFSRWQDRLIRAERILAIIAPHRKTSPADFLRTEAALGKLRNALKKEIDTKADKSREKESDLALYQAIFKSDSPFLAGSTDLKKTNLKAILQAYHDCSLRYNLLTSKNSIYEDPRGALRQKLETLKKEINRRLPQELDNLDQEGAATFCCIAKSIGQTPSLFPREATKIYKNFAHQTLGKQLLKEAKEQAITAQKKKDINALNHALDLEQYIYDSLKGKDEKSFYEPANKAHAKPKAGQATVNAIVEAFKSLIPVDAKTQGESIAQQIDSLKKLEACIARLDETKKKIPNRYGLNLSEEQKTALNVQTHKGLNRGKQAVVDNACDKMDPKKTVLCWDGNLENLTSAWGNFKSNYNTYWLPIEKNKEFLAKQLQGLEGKDPYAIMRGVLQRTLDSIIDSLKITDGENGESRSWAEYKKRLTEDLQNLKRQKEQLERQIGKVNDGASDAPSASLYARLNKLQADIAIKQSQLSSLGKSSASNPQPK